MKYIYKREQIILIAFFLLAVNSFGQNLTIAAASNFRDPLSEIVNLFKKENSTIDIKTVYGSSGNLYNQITKKAPYDIFFSANTNYPQALYDNRLCKEKPTIYAIGKLVLWSKSIDVSMGLDVLKSNKVSKIAIANPVLAPYGLGAVECLKYYSIYDELNSKIVMAENIAQTAQFAVTGNVDVGFLALSQMKMEAIKNKGSYFILPTLSYPSIEQAYVVIQREGNSKLTKKFEEFLLRPDIQQIIIDYGYGIIKNE